MKRLAYPPALGVIGGIIGWRVVSDRDDAAIRRPTVEASAPEVPRDHDPVFTPRGEALDTVDDNWKPVKLSAERATELENLAMHAVYDRCSQFAAFREGSRLRADVQFDKRMFSNVEIELADPAKASGNTLWYTVFFKRDRPASFKATKDIAAKLCGLHGKDIEHGL